MRFPLLLLVLCNGAAVLCHSQGAGLTHDDPAKSREWFEQPRSDMGKLPEDWHVDFSQPFKLPQSVTPKAALWSQGSAIDSKCIVHPPLRSLGALSAGKPILQDRYPGLKVMPVDGDGEKLEAKVEDIPVQWPRLKVDSIPTSWPKLEFDPVAEKSLPLLQSPQK